MTSILSNYILFFFFFFEPYQTTYFKQDFGITSKTFYKIDKIIGNITPLV